MDKTLEDNINLFFKSPTEEDVIPSEEHFLPRRYGVLYLLRRDIRRSLDIVPNRNALKTVPDGLTGAMGILAGIDLLGKFYCGDDTGKVTQRFKDFLHAYFHLSSTDDEETIYQFRNALLHSFGLYSKKRNGKEYHFNVTNVVGVKNIRPLVTHDGHGVYLIDVNVLYNKFENAIEEYSKELANNGDLQKYFSQIFTNYGFVSKMSTYASLLP